MRWLLICLAIAGCARAGKQNSIVGGLNDAGPRGDGGIVPGPDAPLIDAPPQQMTLTETASEGISLGASLLSCHRVPSGFTRENSYYRVFTLSDYSIATTLHVTQVDFGIDTALAGSGGKQPATVRIGTYGGALDGTTLDLSLVRPISSVDIQIPDGNGTRMTVPIAADLAASSSMIVELFIPDGLNDGNQFLIGANASGERKSGYLRGPDCSILDPTTTQSLSHDNMLDEVDLILTVTGDTDVPS